MSQDTIFKLGQHDETTLSNALNKVCKGFHFYCGEYVKVSATSSYVDDLDEQVTIAKKFFNDNDIKFDEISQDDYDVEYGVYDMEDEEDFG